MKVLPVTILKEAVSYNPETGEMTWKKRPLSHFVSERGHRTWNTKWAGTKAFNIPKRDGYLHGCIGYVKYLSHRAAWAIFYGEDPPDQIDHINGIKTDNRLVNLRIVDQTENNRNSSLQKNNTSGVVGVGRLGSKWRAQIVVNRKQIHLGFFATRSSAIAVRKAAEADYGFHPNHGRQP